MPLKALLAFETVIRHRSFTRAASELGVTQSAVSHQLRNLEDDLGLKLLDRGTSGVVPSADGERLFRDVGEAMNLLRLALDEVRETQRTRPVGVQIRSHFALKWLAPRLVEFWQRHPGFDLHFRHSNAPGDFSDPNLHVSIEWCSRDTSPENSMDLRIGGLTPACHPGFLKGENALFQPSDLISHVLLHESDDVCWREWLTLAGIPNLCAARNEFYEDTNVRQQAALEGEGVALVTPSLIKDELGAGQLVLPFDLTLESYSYHLVVPADRLINPAARQFSNWIKRECGVA